MAAPIYVVVMATGGAHAPEYPVNGGPIVMETEVDGATLELAQQRAAMFERRYSTSCRIGRVIFENEPGFIPTPTTEASMPAPKKFPDPQAYAEGERPPIALEPVESSQIGAVGYDEASKTMAVQFRYGARAIYHYAGIEREAFDAFKAAESMGTHFGKNFKTLPFLKYPNEDKAAAEA